jgi:hypothetical protein
VQHREIGNDSLDEQYTKEPQLKMLLFKATLLYTVFQKGPSLRA